MWIGMTMMHFSSHLMGRRRVDGNRSFRRGLKQLRLSHIPRVIGTEGFETKEDWLLFLLENELNAGKN